MCELDFELLHKQSSFSYADAVALAAAKNDPDTPNFKESLSGEHREDFIEAMKKEVSALKKRTTWFLVPKWKLPKGAKIIPTTWAMKIKRFPSGAFRSFKARFCVRGDLQKKAVNDIDTYSPVI